MSEPPPPPPISMLLKWWDLGSAKVGWKNAHNFSFRRFAFSIATLKLGDWGCAFVSRIFEMGVFIENTGLIYFEYF